MSRCVKINLRSRNFNLLLYPEEDITHKNALDYIINNFDNYAYIIHDRDKDENNNIKKSHCHIVLQFKNARWLDSLANELNIKSNYIDITNDLSNSLLYLLHYNNKDKVEYYQDEVKGTLSSKLNVLLMKKESSEGDIISSLIDYIYQQTKPITLTEFVLFCCSAGLYSYYRRSSSTFKSIIDEHNYHCL